MPDDREVPQQGMTPLEQVVHRHRRQRGNGTGNPLPGDDNLPRLSYASICTTRPNMPNNCGRGAMMAG